MKKKRWTQDEKDYLFNNLGKLHTQEIAERLGKSEMAVNLFLLRRRVSPKSVVKNNLLLLLLKRKFINPEYFTPTKDFFKATRIGQKRYWSLYKGVNRPSDEELRRIATHLEIDAADFFEHRQLALFDNEQDSTRRN